MDSIYDSTENIVARLRQMGLKPIDAIVKVAEEMHSQAFRRFYPKVYEGVGDYTSVKRIAAMMFDIAYTSNLMGLNTSVLPTGYSVSYRPVCDMVEHQMPTFFVTRDLVAAALRTEYKDEVDFVSMHLPFEAGTFVLPRNTLVHPEHGDCSFICWGRCQAEKGYVIPGISLFPMYAEHNTMAFFTAAHTDDSMPWLHFNLSDAPGFPRTFKIPTVVPMSPPLKRVTPLDDVLAADDTEFLNRMIKLAFNLFLIKESRPELYREGTMMKRVLKRGKPTEFWSPHILGHQYKIRVVRQATGEHGIDSRRSYWVSGHGKQQAYGPQWSMHKYVWIDPYWVDTGN